MAKADMLRKNDVEDLLAESVSLMRENQKILIEMDDKLRKILVTLSYR